MKSNYQKGLPCSITPFTDSTRSTYFELYLCSSRDISTWILMPGIHSPQEPRSYSPLSYCSNTSSPSQTTRESIVAIYPTPDNIPTTIYCHQRIQLQHPCSTTDLNLSAHYPRQTLPFLLPLKSRKKEKEKEKEKESYLLHPFLITSATSSLRHTYIYIQASGWHCTSVFSFYVFELPDPRGAIYICDIQRGNKKRM